ncbi:MAG: hypothetical protein LBQ14_11510 [Treponema sp.]|nr:hypothetical protein [Treponema sp.]
MKERGLLQRKPGFLRIGPGLAAAGIGLFLLAPLAAEDFGPGESGGTETPVQAPSPFPFGNGEGADPDPEHAAGGDRSGGASAGSLDFENAGSGAEEDALSAGDAGFGFEDGEIPAGDEDGFGVSEDGLGFGDDSGFGFGDDSGFGFGGEDSGGGGLSGAFGGGVLSRFKLSGSVKAELTAYGDDFTSAPKLRDARWGDIFSGKLNFNFSGSNAEAVVNLRLNTQFDNDPPVSFNSSSPLCFDEAYLRAYFGALTLEGGIRKLTWGKADSMGPLDVVNPLDFSNLTSLTDLMDNKIGRPMIRASYSLGTFTKLEGVFMPWFEGYRFAGDGRWAPVQMIRYRDDLKEQLSGAVSTALSSSSYPTIQPLLEMAMGQIIDGVDMNYFYPDTETLNYAQGGLRFTTTVASSDIGFQYFTGNLFRPGVVMGTTAKFEAALGAIIDQITDPINPVYPDQADIEALVDTIEVEIDYNRYHQIGVDYAQVLGGFNLRGELAANITKDLSGSDGLVYNPAILWSLGFDRDLVWGINANLQCNESIRLMDGRVGDDWRRDIEAGKDITSTRITLILSKKFLRDELELNVTGLWGIEDKDFFILPALIWTKGDLTLKASGGVFGGSKEGELGQYRNNGFVKIGLSYSF